MRGNGKKYLNAPWWVYLVAVIVVLATLGGIGVAFSRLMPWSLLLVVLVAAVTLAYKYDKKKPIVWVLVLLALFFAGRWALGELKDWYAGVELQRQNEAIARASQLVQDRRLRITKEWSARVPIPLGRRINWEVPGHTVAYEARSQKGEVLKFARGQEDCLSFEGNLSAVQFRLLPNEVSTSAILAYTISPASLTVPVCG